METKKANINKDDRKYGIVGVLAAMLSIVVLIIALWCVVVLARVIAG